MGGPPDLPDWRDGAAYAPLLSAGRPAIAWEWLRRDPAYRRAAGTHEAGAARSWIVDADRRAAPWGLHAFERPGLAVPAARPVWRRERMTQIVEASADGGGDPAGWFELETLAPLTRLVREASGSEHLLLSDGLRSIRLDIVKGSLLAGPVGLGFRLGGLEGIDRRLLALRQFVHLARTGRFSARLHPAEPRSIRWVLLLRAWDGIARGVDQRCIARHLLGREADEPRWRLEAPALRSRAQRLVRDARRMASGGYWALLGG